MSPRTPDRRPGPFPYLDTPEWRAKFVQAGLADPRCTLDELALRRLSTEIVNIKPLINTRGSGKQAVGIGFRDIEEVPTAYGTIYQLRTKQPGLAGAINQFNIRFAYDVAASGKVAVPRVVPLRTEGGTPMAVVEASFDSETELLEHLKFVEERLVAAEAARPYDLRADLEASGQSERATYHLVRYRIGDQVWDAVAATAGSNRTRHRHDLFGLTPAVGLLGLGQEMLGEAPGARWRDPADWRDRYTSRLNEHADVDPDELAEDDSERHIWATRARQALNVATVDAAIVIGYDVSGAAHADFDAALAATNLRTHLRGPLQFSDDNQALSNGRSLADAAFSEDAISAAEHAVLTGAAPAVGLADTPRESVVALVRLTDRIVFPTDAASQARIKKVLVEPAPSRLGRKHAQAREKVRDALLTMAIGGIDLPTAAMDTPHQKELRSGIPSSGLPLNDLIAAASAPQGSEARALARRELGHLAVPGLANGKVLLGPYGSTGDRRVIATKLEAAASTDDGVTLFVEAIDALTEVAADRGGKPAPDRPGATFGRLRPVVAGRARTDSAQPADSAWFTQHWPEDQKAGGGQGGGSLIASQPSDSERWMTAIQASEGIANRAEKALEDLRANFRSMASMIGPGRELNSVERVEWVDRLDALEQVLADAKNQVLALRQRAENVQGAVTGTIDDFEFADAEGEA